MWGEIVDGNAVYDPHEAQSVILQSNTRFSLFCAGTGSGKTCLGPLWLLNKINGCIKIMIGQKNEGKVPNPIKAMVIAPTYDILGRTVIPTFIEMAHPLLKGKFNRKNYNFKYGTIWFLSCDDPRSVEGGQIDFCWIDEAGQISDEAWKAIQRRTGIKMSPILLTTTPYSDNFIRTEFLERYKNKDPNYLVVQCRSIDNPSYAKEEYERAKDSNDISYFNLFYNGVYLESEGLIFSSFSRLENIKSCSYDSNLKIYVSMDFNVNPMCWCLSHLRGQNLEVFDELYIRNTNTQNTLDILYQKYKDHKNGFIFVGDATSKARKTSSSSSDYIQIFNDERFKKLGRDVNINNSNPSKVDRFAATNARFKTAAGNRYLFIDSRCINLIKDIESRYYKKGTREPDDSGDIGHMTDSLGYLCWAVFPLIPKWDIDTTIYSRKFK